MSLQGCANGSLTAPALTGSSAEAEAAKGERQKKLAPICPTPTDDIKSGKIADYLEKATPDPGLDTLSTEWERLDDGSRTCRSGKVER